MFLFNNSSCVLCGDSVTDAISLCKPCKNDLPLLENACQQCGLPLNDAAVDNSTCGQCIQQPPDIDYTLCLYHYQMPVDFLITELKYNQQLSHAKILGQCLLARLKKENIKEIPDFILPVPLHKQRLVKRGFNQSLEIARPIAKYFDIPIDLKTIRRNRQTLAQANLNITERKKNIRGCFELKLKDGALTGKHIVIIDDVVTTGSTINELAKLLKKAGAEKVGVWSIARAVLN